jgi:hypothetical protein
MTTRRAVPWAALALTAATAVYATIIAHYSIGLDNLLTEEGVMLRGFEEYSRGRVLYRDFLSTYGPYLFLLHHPVLSWWGMEIYPVRLVAGLCHALSVGLTVLLAMRFRVGRAGAMAAGGLQFLLGPWAVANVPYGDYHVYPLVLGWILILHRDGARATFWQGFLAGVAGLLKPPFGIAMVAMSLARIAAPLPAWVSVAALIPFYAILVSGHKEPFVVALSLVTTTLVLGQGRPEAPPFQPRRLAELLEGIVVAGLLLAVLQLAAPMDVLAYPNSLMAYRNALFACPSVPPGILALGAGLLGLAVMPLHQARPILGAFGLLLTLGSLVPESNRAPLGLAWPCIAVLSVPLWLPWFVPDRLRESRVQSAYLLSTVMLLASYMLSWGALRNLVPALLFAWVCLRGRYRWTVTGAGIFLSVAFIFYGILPYHLAARDSLRSGTLQRRHYVLLDPVRGRVWGPESEVREINELVRMIQQEVRKDGVLVAFNLPGLNYLADRPDGMKMPGYYLGVIPSPMAKQTEAFCLDLRKAPEDLVVDLHRSGRPVLYQSTRFCLFGRLPEPPLAPAESDEKGTSDL